MALDITRVRALCFDVDGTLSDTDDQFVHKLAKWMAPVRFALPNRDARPWARKAVMLTESPGNFFFGLPDRVGMDGHLHSLGNFLYRLGLGKTAHPFWLIPGSRETLQDCASHFKLSIVSARDQRSTLRFLQQFEIESYFDCIATAHTCNHTKPYPDPILWCADQMNVKPEECLMIGDTTVDMRAGREAKAQTIGVLSGFGEEPELLQCGADLILSSVAELPQVLRPISSELGQT